ncbi:hypothetical protein MRB53_015610 [Persea americana]|uniref:Uncharacterized protein n=1 Tax=Persea americana TaxID=3435 RepID=A0ACC2M0R5_PERAE|nr:hypothetical protein MRB53_015610 [Persea americana]
MEEETERNRDLFGLFSVGNHRRSFLSPEDSPRNPASLAWIEVSKGERLFVFLVRPPLPEKRAVLGRHRKSKVYSWEINLRSLKKSCVLFPRLFASLGGLSTPDAEVMTWWDYAYKMTALGNTTVIVDDNTWNNTH